MQIALLAIAEQTLRHSPEYVSASALQLYIPGELLRKQLCFPSKVVVYVSKCLAGAPVGAVAIIRRSAWPIPCSAVIRKFGVT